MGTFSFVAQSDRGERVKIILERDDIPAPSNDDPYATVSGRMRAYTESGEDVEPGPEKDTYIVPSIGLVRRVRK